MCEEYLWGSVSFDTEDGTGPVMTEREEKAHHDDGVGHIEGGHGHDYPPPLVLWERISHGAPSLGNEQKCDHDS